MPRLGFGERAWDSSQEGRVSGGGDGRRRTWFYGEVGGRALLEGTVRPCAGSAELSASAARNPALLVNPELVRAFSLPVGFQVIWMLLGTAWA